MKAKTKADARIVITALDLSSYIAKAKRHGTLVEVDVGPAIDEYRQFLLLVWINKTAGNKEFVVPTERADAIWHEHILDSSKYRTFCMNLVGEYIDHFPGLTKGSPAFMRAMEHTKQVHRNDGMDGFLVVYLGMSLIGDSTAERLQAYRERDPEFQESIGAVAAAEGRAAGADPAEGVRISTSKGNVGRKTRPEDVDEAVTDVAGKVADAIGGDTDVGSGGGGGGHDSGGGGGGGGSSCGGGCGGGCGG
ncbi:MAG: hypothetical protein HY455_03030 [Parcubacteria group bacterium]|nr:hypothetical protein [Parcubacteria group bacterium]